MSASLGHGGRFAQLDTLLASHGPLWQIRPFHHRELVWLDSHPDLCAALLALGEEEMARLARDPLALARWMAPWLGEAGLHLLELASLSPLPTRDLVAPERLDTGIPGRKWRQIQDFARVLPAENAPLLEWCAGKGHLGRLLALVDDRPVTSLEWREALCRAGEDAARRVGAAVRFVVADALDPASGAWLPASGQAVALHACGDLHVALMRHWVASGCRRLTLSPCCYHLVGDEVYSPLSNTAAKALLRLSRGDLQLPSQETVTAGQGVRRRSGLEVLWRLAFDEWQRARRGVDEYLPLPSFPKQILSGSFAGFCRWAAAAKGLSPPQTLEESHWLALGEGRLRLARLMELVSHLFRRPLELWLVLDRALYLEEQGAKVRLGTFCARGLTPRNIVLDAERA